jgi:hypothetical protein
MVIKVLRTSLDRAGSEPQGGLVEREVQVWSEGAGYQEIGISW